MAGDGRVVAALTECARLAVALLAVLVAAEVGGTAFADDERVGRANPGASLRTLLLGTAGDEDESEAARARALKCAARAETLTETLTGALDRTGSSAVEAERERAARIEVGGRDFEREAEAGAVVKGESTKREAHEEEGEEEGEKMSSASSLVVASLDTIDTRLAGVSLPPIVGGDGGSACHPRIHSSMAALRPLVSAPRMVPVGPVAPRLRWRDGDGSAGEGGEGEWCIVEMGEERRGRLRAARERDGDGVGGGLGWDGAAARAEGWEGPAAPPISARRGQLAGRRLAAVPRGGGSGEVKVAVGDAGLCAGHGHGGILGAVCSALWCWCSSSSSDKGSARSSVCSCGIDGWDTSYTMQVDVCDAMRWR